MTEIKFGTDGWRAIIAADYTIDNLKRVSDATARWMVGKGMKKVVIGYDTRFGGKMFAEVAATVCAERIGCIIRRWICINTHGISWYCKGCC